MMNVTYEKKKAMTLIGYHTEIRPDEGYIKCPEFWDKEYNLKYARLWQTMKPETPVEEAILANQIGMFAICTESENGFDYWIAGLYQGGAVPEGLELYSFPESSWAVFSAKGPMPGALQTLNTYIWQEWFPNEGQKYQANGMATLEVYSASDPQLPDYKCGIWVPVKGENVMTAFDNSEFEKYKAEAREKWGKTDAYKEHAERTKNYSKQKWNDLVEGMDHIMAEFALCVKKDESPDSAEAQNLVKMLQNYITENYYLCTNEILASLGQMYVADERFTKNIDRHGEGTAAYISACIKSCCA